MPVNVFIAYVDTYIGKQLLRQFEASPHLFTPHGCTWEAEAARELTARAAHASKESSQQQQQQQQQLPQQQGTSSHDEVGEDRDGDVVMSVSNISPISSARGNDSHSTVQPGGTLPLGAGDSVRSAATDVVAAMAATATTAMLTTATAGVAAATSTFFHRRDIPAVRAALAACEWVILELRESQDVLELLRGVQQGPFPRPKRLVLLSSFMTWFATPPLTVGDPAAEAEAEVAAAALAQMEHDAAEGAGESGGEGIGSDVNAPYPPPPPPLPDSDRDENDEEVAGDTTVVEGEGAGEAGGAAREVLTEDQYNRRVPHVRYYNWREAEKAVAAAHHAKGLPLDTYVVFAGLPYGEGESALEPFFRAAWSGSSGGTLPLFGSGEQRVPMIHVRDLATLTRKLLHRPASALPSRYIVATDGARPTWRAVMAAVNRSFGGRCALTPVPAAELPLRRDVEQLTVDLRVERGTMAAIVEESGGSPNPEEGDVGPGPVWICEGGLPRAAERVAWEFCVARGVTPLRIVVQGPPLAGKRHLGERLAAAYRLPCFTVEEAVAAYEAHLAGLRARVGTFHGQLLDSELARRRGIKRRRLLKAFRSGRLTDPATVAAVAAAVAGGEGEDGAAETAGEGAAEARRMSSARRASNARRAPAVASTDVDADALPDGPAAAAFELTEAEVQEARELVAERVATSARVARWQREAGEMERVLLMRVRVVGAAGGADDAAGGGPMKKRAAASAAAAGASAAAKSKKLTKEQQRKREEEELQMAKDALRGAPFQDRALALMLRWRLAQPDARTQGYLLHGFPRTVAQARLVFGSEPLLAPATEEEALHPPPSTLDGTGAGGNGAGQPNGGDDEDGARGVVDPLAGLTSEPCDERRLPDHVLVLEAAEGFLLDRLAAAAALRESSAAQGAAAAVAVAAAPAEDRGESASAAAATGAAGVAGDALATFNAHLRLFHEQFVAAPYSLPSFWACAVTAAGSVTPGGRRVAVHTLAADAGEPLVPPPPESTSAYARPPPPSALELAARALVGAPHSFGPTPAEVHREEVREARLAEEQRAAEAETVAAAHARDAAAYATEQRLRDTVEDRLQQVKAADLAALEARRAPLRDYLMQSVIPLVSKGLVEVAANRPENPLAYLSEWLVRHNPNCDVFAEI